MRTVFFFQLTFQALNLIARSECKCSCIVIVGRNNIDSTCGISHKIVLAKSLRI